MKSRYGDFHGIHNAFIVPVGVWLKFEESIELTRFATLSTQVVWWGRCIANRREQRRNSDTEEGNRAKRGRETEISSIYRSSLSSSLNSLVRSLASSVIIRPLCSPAISAALSPSTMSTWHSPSRSHTLLTHPQVSFNHKAHRRRLDPADCFKRFSSFEKAE